MKPAALKSDSDIMALLLNVEGADEHINASGNQLGLTPLHRCARGNGDLRICQLLLAAGADPFMVSDGNMTCADMAAGTRIHSLLQTWIPRSVVPRTSFPASHGVVSAVSVYSCCCFYLGGGILQPVFTRILSRASIILFACVGAAEVFHALTLVGMMDPSFEREAEAEQAEAEELSPLRMGLAVVALLPVELQVSHCGSLRVFRGSPPESATSLDG